LAHLPQDNPAERPKARSPQEVAAALKAATESNVRGALEGLISGYHPMDIAFAFGLLEPEEREAVFALLTPEDAGVVLEEVDDQISADLAEVTDDRQLAEIIDAMPPDSGADMVSLLEPDQQHRILEHIPDEESEELETLMAYGDDTAGGLMTSDVMYAPPDVTPADVMAHIRTRKIPPESLSYIYVVDEQRHLIGVVDLAELVTTPPDSPLSEVMVADIVAVHPDTDQEEVARLVDHYDLVAVPVVDDAGTLLGTVTIDDVIDAIQQEHTEDISRLGGTAAETLMSASSLKVARLRFPWLVMCLFGTFLSASVIVFFKLHLKEAIGLVVFIPVINAMSGNSGLQSSTIMVRAIALGLVSAVGVGKALLREFITALIIGVLCGVLAGIGGALLSVEHPGYGLIVGLSLACAIMWGVMLGTTMPLVFNRLRIDPALASGPLVTTFNDSVALIIYFSIATLLLQFWAL